jgi:hypothetical protein
MSASRVLQPKRVSKHDRFLSCFDTCLWRLGRVKSGDVEITVRFITVGFGPLLASRDSLEMAL